MPHPLGRTVLLVVLTTFLHSQVYSQGAKGAPEFYRHQVTQPRLFHSRDNYQLSTSRINKNGLEHVQDIVLKVNIKGQDHVLDLRLNRELLPNNHFLKRQENGSHVVHKPSREEVELCQYQGEIRDIPGSWAAISTCPAIRGVVFDGVSLHYIDRVLQNETHVPISLDEIEHHIYSHEDLIANHTCGYEGTDAHDIRHEFAHNRINRYKRSPEMIRGPYNANRRSRYVELVLVVDNKVYKSMGQNLDSVHTRCKDIANIINALYVPLNIFIALVGVVVWTESDEIALSAKGDTTLTNFLHYRREKLVKDHPNDNAQLLTKVQFEGGVVGKALKGPICTFEFSGGVSMDHSAVVGLVATTVAHEMGHNFGMEHDSQDCHCPDDRCIMAPSSSTMSPTHWSTCSLEYLALAFDHGMDYCLRNKPERLFDSPVCGNGFVEVGEQCDCGLKNRCNNPCCNASTCMLYSNASCATGECCDLTTCHPKVAGSMCRSADHECDLPEYCTGQSEFCPSDVFKMDGETCDKGKAFCYQGTCRSHTDQCKLLWGPSGKSSDSQCYKMNTKGSRHGNCGYNRLNQSYIKCFDENIYCGMLHCIHLNERLEFGMESVAILSHSFINSGGSIIPCRTAIVDLGLNEVDPGLAPDGARCAEGKMCVGQRCMAVGALLAETNCLNNCNGNGVCNSRGHCHCNAGFAPPYCHDPGTGGSEDSGPATQPHARREVINAFYIVFLGIVPSVALVSLFVYYIKRNPVFLKKPRTKITEKKLSGVRVSRSSPGGGGKGYNREGVEISGPLIVDQSRTTLLPKGGVARGEDVSNMLQSNLVGQFKGFSIKQLHKPEEQGGPATAPQQGASVPTRPAPSVQQQGVPVRPAPSVHQQAAAPIRPAPKVPDPTPPKLPPANQPQPNQASANQPSRLVISSPVLDATTSCTAKELIGDRVGPPTSVPVRPAPKVPEKTTEPSKSAADKSRPPSVDLEEKKRKESSYPTLTRIASFMRGQKPEPIKKQKLDKETLRNLQISDPIPQKEVEMPVAVVAAGEKNVVMRAQSMRENTDAGKRAPIPSFGSMRAGQGVKRPTSIPVSGRPTSPPPPRPPSVPGLPGYQGPKPEHPYDDCLNLADQGVAPLAHIDEESPDSPKENIYAVIEESPVDPRSRKIVSTPARLLEGSAMSTGNSSESMGLLGEIVSEIQARNTDSIYSASTLKRKKAAEEEAAAADKNQTYVNSSWKNEGYTELDAPKSTTSSSSSNSGYLSPIDAQNKAFNPTTTTVVKSEPSVPETSAPSYKPFSSVLQRNAGPLAASYNTPSAPKKDVKPQLTRNKTPPKLTTGLQRTKTPPGKITPGVHRSNSQSGKESEDVKPPLKKLTTVRTQQTGLNSPKPDIVSSCATSETMKSPPDVLGKQGPNKIGSKQPMPAPKPVLTKAASKPAIKPEAKTLADKAAASNKTSKVASLQQKFENTNPPIKTPTVITKNTVENKSFTVKR